MTRNFSPCFFSIPIPFHVTGLVDGKSCGWVALNREDALHFAKHMRERGAKSVCIIRKHLEGE